MVHFSEEKKRVGFLVGFTVFFKWAFKKRVFFGWFNYKNPEDKMIMDV